MNELLKRSFVTAAQSVHGESSRVVSRLTTTTGVHQRDVTSLLRGSLDEAPPPRSLAAEVFAQWTNDPAYRSAKGPRVLPRVGDVPSFESLAQAVTRDVHPRSLLDEICRLGVATPNAQGDTVALSASAFIPHKDQARMLSFVRANVGDRASAAVENVIEGGGRYFEQAVFADALSAAPVEWARQQAAVQWQVLIAAMVPSLKRQIEDDDAQCVERTHRLRVGLYSFDTAPLPGRTTRYACASAT